MSTQARSLALACGLRLNELCEIGVLRVNNQASGLLTAFWFQRPMAIVAAKAIFDYQTGSVDAALEFLKRTRGELRSLQKVRVWPDRLHVIDVNKDYFEIRGLGYTQPDIVPVLQNINTAFNKDTIHNPTNEPYKEFQTGRRYTWAQDRVM